MIALATLLLLGTVIAFGYRDWVALCRAFGDRHTAERRCLTCIDQADSRAVAATFPAAASEPRIASRPQRALRRARRGAHDTDIEPVLTVPGVPAGWSLDRYIADGMSQIHLALAQAARQRQQPRRSSR